mmetsp:Transcript_96746/g.300854  ORF Transcript_96746/g.300854 Transcript_96746/m.300854 type:complete len:234 (-) Transcript_96746:394-1095(-)
MLRACIGGRATKAGASVASLLEQQVAGAVALRWELCGGLPCNVPCGARAFTVKRVTQRRRSRGRIIQLKQTHYEPKPDDYEPLPVSLLASGPIRRVLRAGTVEAKELAATVDWNKYKCDTKGVRWHPVGGWRVQFDRRDYEHNFFVKCSCYFRVSIHGFDRAKELAIGYRKRLEAEWDEQQRIWAKLDAEREAARLKRREERERALLAKQFEGDAQSIWGTEALLPEADGTQT